MKKDEKKEIAETRKPFSLEEELAVRGNFSGEEIKEGLFGGNFYGQ